MKYLFTYPCDNLFCFFLQFFEKTMAKDGRGQSRETQRGNLRFDCAVIFTVPYRKFKKKKLARVFPLCLAHFCVLHQNSSSCSSLHRVHAYLVGKLSAELQKQTRSQKKKRLTIKDTHWLYRVTVLQ